MNLFYLASTKCTLPVSLNLAKTVPVNSGLRYPSNPGCFPPTLIVNHPGSTTLLLFALIIESWRLLILKIIMASLIQR